MSCDHLWKTTPFPVYPQGRTIGSAVYVRELCTECSASRLIRANEALRVYPAGWGKPPPPAAPSSTEG